MPIFGNIDTILSDMFFYFCQVAITFILLWQKAFQFHNLLAQNCNGFKDVVNIFILDCPVKNWKTNAQNQVNLSNAWKCHYQSQECNCTQRF